MCSLFHRNLKLSVTSCSYFFYFLFVNSRIKHGPQVCEVEDDCKAKNQVQQHHPKVLQTGRRVSINMENTNPVVFINSDQGRPACADGYSLSCRVCSGYRR